MLCCPQLTWQTVPLVAPVQVVGGVEHDVGVLLQEGDAQEPAEVGGGEAVVVVEAHLFSGTPSGGFKASPGHTMSFISTCS